MSAREAIRVDLLTIKTPPRRKLPARVTRSKKGGAIEATRVDFSTINALRENSVFVCVCVCVCVRREREREKKRKKEKERDTEKRVRASIVS